MPEAGPDADDGGSEAAIEAGDDGSDGSSVDSGDDSG
jgi:hypothetical protein